MNKSKEGLALEYPQLCADLDWCYECLFDLCGGTRKKAVMNVPPQPKDFDMQISAAFDELEAYRATNLDPEGINTLARSQIATAKRNVELQEENERLRKELHEYENMSPEDTGEYLAGL